MNGLESIAIDEEFSKEHNDTYNNLPSTFLLDEFRFECHS